ncbi:Variable major outer membrane lipoprotein, partial [Borrelia duttonii CR2A]
MQETVKTAIVVGVSEPKVGTAVLNVTGTDNKEGAKILSTDSNHKPGATDAGKAAAILSTVSGEEMLGSIINSKEVKELSAQATADTTPLEFAKGGTGDYLGKDATPKATAVAGGIALR